MNKEIIEKLLKSSKCTIVKGDILSGKTSRIMFPIVSSSIDKNENLLIIDSKKEYLNNFYDRLNENNYNLVILNLQDYNSSEGFNPLEYPAFLYKKGKTDESLNILETLNRIIFYEESELDPFWSNSASDFITGIELALFEDATPEETNYKNINALFNECNEAYGSEDFMKVYIKHKGTNSSIYNYASGTTFAPTETKGGIMSFAKQQLKVLTSREELTKLMSKTTFNFNECFTKKTAIIIIPSESTSINKLASMLISEIYRILSTSNNNLSWNFILDNLDSIEYISNLKDMFKSSYVHNTKIHTCVKSLNEFTRIYGSYIKDLANLIEITENDVNTLIDNTETKEKLEKEEITHLKANIKYPHPTIKKIKSISFADILKKLNIEKPATPEELINRIENKLTELDK